MVFELRNRRGLREISARESSAAAGVFATFGVHRAAGRRAGQARAAERSNGRPLIVENLVTTTFPLC